MSRKEPAVAGTGGGDCPGVEDQIRALWAKNRLLCGWFAREDFEPHTTPEMRTCLLWLEKHGDRATYVAARKLKKCL